MTRSFQQIRSLALTLAPIGLFAMGAFGVLWFDRPIARAADSITPTASAIATPRFTTTPITPTVRATNTLTGTLAASTRTPTARSSPASTPTQTATAITRTATSTITPTATTTITRTATATPALGAITGRLTLQGKRATGEIFLIAARDQIAMAAATLAPTITGTRSATLTPTPFAARDVFTTTISASAASFSIALPPGIYTITARRPGFLPISRAAVQIASGKSFALPESALIGGDVNGDGEINARDVALISAHFAKTKDFDVNADINGDGIVNVLDLVIVTQNLGRKGTVPW